MKQDKILQTSLLDIIFTNRNKEYGAYMLRKEYSHRMRIAVFSMVGITLIFSVCILNKRQETIPDSQKFLMILPDKVLTTVYKEPEPSPKKILINPVKKIATIAGPPKIVSSIIINKLPATPLEIPASVNGKEISEINFPSELNGAGDGKNIEITAVAKPLATPKPVKPTIAEVAEIMPQYPGGINALLSFLKKNLRAPETIDQGEDVSVKIKFVVNYNGKLEGFDVVKSGGGIFDNEVIRVLKKMPLWIPGKTNGENVSVYYVVPVTFTGEF